MRKKSINLYRSSAKAEITYAGDLVVPSSLVQQIVSDLFEIKRSEVVIGTLCSDTKIRTSLITKNVVRDYSNNLTIWGYNPITSIEMDFPIDMKKFTPNDVNEFTHLIIKQSVTIINNSGKFNGRTHTNISVFSINNLEGERQFPFYKI